VTPFAMKLRASSRPTIGSAIEVVNYEADDQKRSLDLDWRLVIGETRHQVLKCRIERQCKQWKIMDLEPGAP
jgi:hypothetical protein